MIVLREKSFRVCADDNRKMYIVPVLAILTVSTMLSTISK